MINIIRESERGISLNGGVIIIGSLLWDIDDIRKNWRNSCLNIDEKFTVAAPIRYGRISKVRHCTFSMVYSNECNSTHLLGAAYFVPFVNNPIDIADLKLQSIELIKSEHHKSSLDFKRFNWGWGTLAITINPKSLKPEYEKSNQIKILLDFWENQYGNGFNSDHYKVGNETPVVNNRGILSFNWTNELNDFDFAITTATKPERDSYPTARNIAERIKANEYSEYFIKNVENGISTFQDDEVLEILKVKK